MCISGDLDKLPGDHIDVQPYRVCESSACVEITYSLLRNKYIQETQRINVGESGAFADDFFTPSWAQEQCSEDDRCVGFLINDGADKSYEATSKVAFFSSESSCVPVRRTDSLTQDSEGQSYYTVNRAVDGCQLAVNGVGATLNMDPDSDFDTATSFTSEAGTIQLVHNVSDLHDLDCSNGTWAFAVVSSSSGSSGSGGSSSSGAGTVKYCSDHAGVQMRLQNVFESVNGGNGISYCAGSKRIASDNS